MTNQQKSNSRMQEIDKLTPFIAVKDENDSWAIKFISPTSETTFFMFINNKLQFSDCIEIAYALNTAWHLGALAREQLGNELH